MCCVPVTLYRSRAGCWEPSGTYDVQHGLVDGDIQLTVCDWILDRFFRFVIRTLSWMWINTSPTVLFGLAYILFVARCSQWRNQCVGLHYGASYVCREHGPFQESPSSADNENPSGKVIEDSHVTWTKTHLTRPSSVPNSKHTNKNIRLNIFSRCYYSRKTKWGTWESEF